jgi:hypothetical protein
MLEEIVEMKEEEAKELREKEESNNSSIIQAQIIQLQEEFDFKIAEAKKDSKFKSINQIPNE